MWWDNAACSTRTVAQCCRNDEFACATDLHSLNAFIPSLDYMACAQGKLKWFIAVFAGVE